MGISPKTQSASGGAKKGQKKSNNQKSQRRSVTLLLPELDIFSIAIKIMRGSLW